MDHRRSGCWRLPRAASAHSISSHDRAPQVEFSHRAGQTLDNPGDQDVAVGRNTEAKVHSFRFQSDKFELRGHIPHTDRMPRAVAREHEPATLVEDDQPRSVRGKLDGRDPATVVAEFQDSTALGDIPDLDGTVGGTGGKPASILQNNGSLMYRWRIAERTGQPGEHVATMGVFSPWLGAATGPSREGLVKND